MKINSESIRNKLTKLTGYGGMIHTNGGLPSTADYSAITTDGAALRIHDDYDEANNLIPFIFDNSETSTDYYKERTVDGKPDPRAKIDAMDEDLKEMLYQQKLLFTVGSITSATFIVTALLLARNNSS